MVKNLQHVPGNWEGIAKNKPNLDERVRKILAFIYMWIFYVLHMETLRSGISIEITQPHLISSLGYIQNTSTWSVHTTAKALNNKYMGKFVLFLYCIQMVIQINIKI